MRMGKTRRKNGPFSRPEGLKYLILSYLYKKTLLAKIKISL